MLAVPREERDFYSCPSKEKIERMPFKVGKIPLVKEDAKTVACHGGVVVKKLSRTEESTMKKYSARVFSCIVRTGNSVK